MLDKLADIAQDLKSARTPLPVSVRTFLEWFEVQRRGTQIVERIRAELEEAGVETNPDFESAYIDGEIEFRLTRTQNINTDGVSPNFGFGQATVEEEETQAAPQEPSGETPFLKWISHDPTFRVSKLQAANKTVISVKPDGTLAEAITLLLTGGYSQLPVMQSEHDLKGMISWKSIGSKLARGKNVSVAREAMEPAYEIKADVSIFDAISIIVREDYVLVRGGQNKISGIITSSDLSFQLRSLTEPFLLLSEIENSVRNMIGEAFTKSELQGCRGPDMPGPEIETVFDLAFGDYIILLQHADRWERLKLFIDRKTFCAKLDEVRVIRNRVMHFDPDGIVETDLASLYGFTSLLRQLQ